jgi:hypothetical protein
MLKILKAFLKNQGVRNWIHLAQDMVQRLAVINKIKTLVSIKVGSI